MLRINDALGKLEQEDPEQARIVVLKFFGGFRRTSGGTSRWSERTAHSGFAPNRGWVVHEGTGLTRVFSDPESQMSASNNLKMPCSSRHCI